MPAGVVSSLEEKIKASPVIPPQFLQVFVPGMAIDPERLQPETSSENVSDFEC
jgi:hypothetical protein